MTTKISNPKTGWILKEADGTPVLEIWGETEDGKDKSITFYFEEDEVLFIKSTSMRMSEMEEGVIDTPKDLIKEIKWILKR